MILCVHRWNYQSLQKKLRVDNASDELVDLISDMAVYLPYVELKRAFIPLTGKYLKNQT